MSGIYTTPDGQKVHGDGKPIGASYDHSELSPAHGSEVPTPRTDKWEYEQECNFDVPWEEHCRQLEREVLRLGAALNEQNERWGLYGNDSQAALRSFKELNASAGLPNELR